MRWQLALVGVCTPKRVGQRMAWRPLRVSAARSLHGAVIGSRTMGTSAVRDKVELHLHLDGAVRPATILDLAKKRGVHLPADNVKDLTPHLQANENTKSLTDFLACFGVFMPTIVGDREAVKRIAYELCEDSASAGVIYSEFRYSPHLLVGPKFPLDEVVKAVNEGVEKGCKDFGIIVRTILCCMRHEPSWDAEILDLCVKYKDAGVVGIDLAGDEIKFPSHPEHIKIFQKAKELGVHRTVHAGESGPAASVKQAVHEMCAERIGHGYHTIDDPAIYKEMLERRIHFEICPHSSLLTGAVTAPYNQHPVIKFCRDGANFSISTDDPTVCACDLNKDYDLVTTKMGLTRKDLAKANLNAAQSCFLPDADKQKLVAQVKEVYKAELS